MLTHFSISDLISLLNGCLHSLSLSQKRKKFLISREDNNTLSSSFNPSSNLIHKPSSFGTKSLAYLLNIINSLSYSNTIILLYLSSKNSFFICSKKSILMNLFIFKQKDGASQTLGYGTLQLISYPTNLRKTVFCHNWIVLFTTSELFGTFLTNGLHNVPSYRCYNWD